jgi:hypothetical protein
MLALAVIIVTLLVITLLEAARAVAADGYWDRLAACETHGRWHQRGSVYVGGLGIYWRNWQQWADELGIHKAAWVATREEQIAVARWGRMTDHAYWGCQRVVGDPPNA